MTNISRSFVLFTVSLASTIIKFASHICLLAGDDDSFHSAAFLFNLQLEPGDKRRQIHFKI